MCLELTIPSSCKRQRPFPGFHVSFLPCSPGSNSKSWFLFLCPPAYPHLLQSEWLSGYSNTVLMIHLKHFLPMCSSLSSAHSFIHPSILYYVPAVRDKRPLYFFASGSQSLSGETNTHGNIYGTMWGLLQVAISNHSKITHETSSDVQWSRDVFRDDEGSEFWKICSNSPKGGEEGGHSRQTNSKGQQVWKGFAVCQHPKFKPPLRTTCGLRPESPGLRALCSYFRMHPVLIAAKDPTIKAQFWWCQFSTQKLYIFLDLNAFNVFLYYQSNRPFHLLSCNFPPLLPNWATRYRP